MEVDKVLSKLWHLRGNTDGLVTREKYEKEAKDTAYMAINTIKGLQEEINELKIEVTKEDIKRVQAILDRSEDLCEEHADDKEWLMDKFIQRAASKS
ncbi:hypothetical protein CON64_12340 [Bacillus pseudomycoides]|nr:hypothetical protein CON64_12340 [Bacillus pseudomycoides]